MRIANIHRSAASRLALGWCAVLALLLSAAAFAQMSDQMVGGPMSTKRFDRLLQAHVRPSDDEAAALDRLHEAYLDRFRAEIDPELATLLKGLTGGTPSLQEFRRLMREIERLQARIADADRALFDGAAEVLSEEHQIGLARVRSARERQRALGGFTGMSSAIFGGGGAFVDLTDLMARERVLRAVPADMQQRFNAIAEAQEGRLLTQAQRLDRTTAKALDGYYEAMLSLQEALAQPAPSGETPEQQETRRRADIGRMVALAAQFGEEPRKILQANFAANRAAMTELAGVLPEAALAELRIDAALRSLGRTGIARIGGDPRTAGTPAPPTVAARLRRSGALDQNGIERSRAIVDAWRIEHARAIEEFAEAMFEAGPRLDNPADPASPAHNDPDLLRIARSGDTVRAVEQKALRALAELAGARAAEFVVAREMQGEPSLVSIDSPESADSVLQGLAKSPGRLTGAFFQYPNLTRPPDARELDERLALLGVKPEARALLETVVAEWKSREYEARFAPALAEWRVRDSALAAEMRGPITDAAARERHAAVRAAFESAQSAAVDAYFAAENALFSDVAAALALDADGPEITALRLMRVGLLERESVPLATPLAVIAQAGIGVESGRALLTQSLPTWRALAQSIETRVRERRARSAELGRLQWLEFGTADSAQWQDRMVELARRIDLADRADDARIRGELDSAIAALEPTDPTTARALRTAAQQIRYPDLHRPSESASAQLASAVALEGLDDTQLARLEALKAEYDSVFASLTDRMVETSAQIAASTPEQFEASIAQRETLEKLRFQRTERTEKARREARRILGDALASRIRGLVPNEDDELLAPKHRGPQPFSATIGDDDD